MTTRRWMIAVAVVACILTLLEIAPPALLLIWVLCGVVHAPSCWDRLRGRYILYLDLKLSDGRRYECED
jgi:hypothetical protein